MCICTTLYRTIQNKQQRGENALKYSVKECKSGLNYTINNNIQFTQQHNNSIHIAFMYAMWLTTWFHACGTNLDIKGLILISSVQKWFLIQTESPLLNLGSLLLNLGSPLLNPGQSLVPTYKSVTRFFQHTDTKWCMTYKVMQQQPQNVYAPLLTISNMQYNIHITPNFWTTHLSTTTIITFTTHNYIRNITVHKHNHNSPLTVIQIN